MKKNKKIKIIILLLVIMLSCLLFSNVNAQITINKNGDATSIGTSHGVISGIIGGVQKLVEYIFGRAVSGVLATVTNLINLLTLAMYLALNVLFGLTLSNGTELFYTPMPDNIVFNRFSFFDANFIKPADGSMLKGMGSTLNNLFASFQTIAISLFIIAAMIVGIKMALSTVASKKAQYKEAALKWITGFLILLCLKWIIAGIFYINELLVAKMFSISKADDVKIPVYITDAIPIYGKLLTDLFKAVSSLWGGNGTLIEVGGYFGIFLANLCKSIGGDIIASIMGFVIMGQTFTIIGSYIKRVFMCALLGMISPLIVVVDTITSITGKQSTVLKSWLKNFSTTVFMQFFHAAYMVVVLQILAGLYAQNSLTGLNATQVGIISIVLLTGLVKLEKLIKGMFGIGDSFAGDLKDGAKGMVKAMGAVKGLSEGFKAVSDNKQKETDAGKRKMAYMSELAKMKEQGGKKGSTVNVTNNNTNNSSDNSTSNNSSNDTHNVANNTTSNSSGNGNSLQHSTGDYLQDVLNNQAQNLTREQKIHKLEEAIAEETANENSAKFARIMAPANIAAGIGLGLGMGEDVGESLFKGGYITKGLDYASEKVGYRAAGGKRRSFYESEKKDGEKYGYEPSEKIVKEKTTVEKTVTNGQLYVNPVAVSKEWKKQFSELGDVFGDTMKKKMKEIDKDLDNA